MRGWGATVVVLLVCGGTPVVHAQGTDTSVALTQWQARWTDLTTNVLLDPDDAPGWEAMTLPGRVTPAGDVLWLRTRLPKGAWKQPALRIDSVIGNNEIYLDDTLLLVRPAQGLTGPTTTGVPWLLINLPEDPSGRLLTIRVRITYRPGGVRGVPMLGERDAHLTWAMEHGTPRLVVGFLMVLMGLLSLLLITRPRAGAWKVPLGFALSTVSVGGFVVYHTFIKDILWPAPVGWFLLWVVVVPVWPVGQFLFLDAVFGTGPRGVTARFLKIHLAYAVLLAPLDAVCFLVDRHGDVAAQSVSTLVFGVALLGLRGLVIVSSAAALVVVGRHAWRGNRDAQIYVVGLLCQWLALADAMVAAFGLERGTWNSQAHWGSLALSVALMLILQRRDRTLNQQLQHQAGELLRKGQEKERMLADLHDGVGSLATNIHMLAELGRKNEARARQSLGTIEELSGRALAELRAFVLTLDETNADWTALSSEIRRFGAQLVEGQGRTFEMTARLLDAPPPTGLQTMSLLRIFKESITNALKHGQGPVAVTLEVTPVQATLRVENTAGAQGAVGVNARRGLHNMKNRALELGGTLDLELRDGQAALSLVFPIPHKPPTGAALTSGPGR
jgi:signal transduction histidine kinase